MTAVLLTYLAEPAVRTELHERDQTESPTPSRSLLADIAKLKEQLKARDVPTVLRCLVEPGKDVVRRCESPTRWWCGRPSPRAS